MLSPEGLQLVAAAAGLGAMIVVPIGVYLWRVGRRLDRIERALAMGPRTRRIDFRVDRP